jgi:pimeloyl-ACP methyl ester carboxylesterase
MAATDAPVWFTTYVDQIPADDHVEVAGAEVHYLRWGDPTTTPGLVFIHGGAAHAHWWSHVAPAFLPDHSAVAVDLTGHGDSGHRDEYLLETWCEEVASVIAHAGFVTPPVLVGHSMGGFVTTATAALHPDVIGGAVIIDSPIIAVDPEVNAARVSDQFSKAKTYDDLETAVARFRVVPGQDVMLPYVADHVARRSLRPSDEGWTWKFDRGIFMPRRRQAAEFLSRVQGRVALLRAEHGLVTEDIGRHMYEQLGRVAPVIELPTAGHHPMLDVPLILITALRSLLADWEHSIPYIRQPFGLLGVPATPEHPGSTPS